MFLYSCPHSTSEGRQVRGWIRVIWRLWGWWWRWVWESCAIWISSANQGMWWYRMLSFWCTIFSWSIQCLCLKLLQFFGASLLLRGCLHDTGVTEAPVEVHSSSLSWLSICLHDTITKCHAFMSHSGVSSPWLLFSLGARITLWYKILQWYHVNANWPTVSVWNRSAGGLEWVALA